MCLATLRTVLIEHHRKLSGCVFVSVLVLYLKGVDQSWIWVYSELYCLDNNNLCLGHCA